jgi:hypothetical protein
MLFNDAVDWKGAREIAGEVNSAKAYVTKNETSR